MVEPGKRLRELCPEMSMPKLANRTGEWGWERHPAVCGVPCGVCAAAGLPLRRLPLILDDSLTWQAKQLQVD